MTHDELLAYINEEVEVCDPGCNSHKAHNQPWLALRAVVELCRKYGDDYYTEDFADLIIEAIKKELG